MGHSDPAVGYANGHSGPVSGIARGYPEGHVPEVVGNLRRGEPGGDCDEVEQEGDEEHYTAQVWDALDSLEQVRSQPWASRETEGTPSHVRWWIAHALLASWRRQASLGVPTCVPCGTWGPAVPLEGLSAEPRSVRAWQIEPTIQAGPRWKLETFLEALDILGEARAVLEVEECAKGMHKAEALLRVGLAQLVEEFQDALHKCR